LPDASIAVEAAELAVPLMILTAQREQVLVQIPEPLSGSVHFRGEASRNAAVPWGEEIYVGRVRLAFIAEVDQGKRSQGLLLGALAALVAALAGWWAASSSHVAAGSDATPPPLLGTSVACREHTPEAALARGDEALATALAKAQRAPFARHDGVEALALLGEAQACFDSTGARDQSAIATAQRERLKAQLDDDYAALRLRLQLALDQNRPAEGLAAVRGLESLLGGLGPSPYRTWLAGQRRDLERKMAQSTR
jgi:hypothetical protein